MSEQLSKKKNDGTARCCAIDEKPEGVQKTPYQGQPQDPLPQEGSFEVI